MPAADQPQIYLKPGMPVFFAIDIFQCLAEVTGLVNRYNLVKRGGFQPL